MLAIRLSLTNRSVSTLMVFPPKKLALRKYVHTRARNYKAIIPKFENKVNLYSTNQNLYFYFIFAIFAFLCSSHFATILEEIGKFLLFKSSKNKLVFLGFHADK